MWPCGQGMFCFLSCAPRTIAPRFLTATEHRTAGQRDFGSSRTGMGRVVCEGPLLLSHLAYEERRMGARHREALGGDKGMLYVLAQCVAVESSFPVTSTGSGTVHDFPGGGQGGSVPGEWPQSIPGQTWSIRKPRGFCHRTSEREHCTGCLWACSSLHRKMLWLLLW